MTKDVLVKISGLQFAEDQDNGPVEIITTGNYYKKNGKHYILYDEVQEGFDGVTKSVIKVNDDFLDVTKKGVTNVHMMFEKNVLLQHAVWKSAGRNQRHRRESE